ncbi:MAG: cytochrome c biogenesis protein CcsA [Caldilineales bacterium]
MTAGKRSGRETFWMVLTGITGVLILIGLYMSLMWAPTAANLPTVNEQLAQRIFYFHVSAGWVGYVAFGVTAAASVLYLIKRQRRFDNIAVSSAEIGVVFTAANLVSGSIWARPTWNTWWTWDDPRLTLAAIVLMVYIAYLMLRNAIDDPERKARLASIYGIVGFISVPLSFVSVRIWRTIHPAVIGTASETSQGGFDMSGNMVIVLLFSIFTFSLLYFVLLHYRLCLEDQRVELEEYKMAALAEA